ncbi:hypothetical protein QTG54_011437, partial [Skeletonema marinoi]
MDHKQKLTFVLLCSGNGADSSLYRPNGDDKRYRHRHDALVRCVAVSLFSAAGACTITDGRSCELILLYEDSCMRMSMSSKSREQQVPASFTQQPPPLEKDIVTAWKNAANEATRLRQQQHTSSIGTMGSSFTRNQNGCNMTSSTSLKLVTKCVLDESPPNQTDDASSKAKHKLPSHMPASKRDAISILQSSCSLEFLRSHHLNVPLAVALKKFNKNKLQSVWDDAKKHDGASSSSDYSTQQPDSSRIERTFRKILSEAKGKDTTNGYSTDVLAAYLHESCDSELPCWSEELYDRNKEVKHIFLFCGAVRDMTDAENDSLSNVCEQMKIPLLPCRLGPVPEFTSKIVCVAGYHFYKGLLGSGLIKLWERKQPLERSQEVITKSQPLSNNVSHKRSLHTIAMIPFDSTTLTADPSKRCRVHWCMVRLCVCSLYRSKFASTTREALLDNNKLSFVFQDGLAINLNQRDFISSLAEKHQAAPSERQILEEICRCRDETLSQECNDSINQLISSYTQKNDHQGETYALDFTDELHRTSKQVIELAYDEDCPLGDAGDSTLLAVIKVRDQSGHANTKMHKRIIDAIAAANIQVRNQSLLVSEAQDCEALTVVMLQHLDYQSKLFGLLRHAFENGSSEAIISDVATTKERRRKRK